MENKQLEITRKNYYAQLKSRYYLYLLLQKITPILLIFFNNGPNTMRIVGYSVVGYFEFISWMFAFILYATGKSNPAQCRCPKKNKMGLETTPTQIELEKERKNVEDAVACSSFWGIIASTFCDSVCFFYYGIWAIALISDGKIHKYERFMWLVMIHTILTVIFYIIFPSKTRLITEAAMKFKVELDKENLANDHYKLVRDKFVNGEYVDFAKILNGGDGVQAQGGYTNVGGHGGFNINAKF